jgi:hypothetical protein
MTDPGKAQKLAPKVVKPTPILPAERGVLQFPAAAPIDVRQGTLTHAAGGLVTDDKPAPFRPRVSVFLGPGATFIGLADLLRPLYEAAEAAGGDAAPQPLNLARGFLQYNAAYLPAGTWDHHRVGLRLPLPIEIDSPGHWIVNARKILELSSVFNDKVSGPRLKTPPNPLFISEPDGFETEADIDVKDPMVPATICAIRSNRSSCSWPCCARWSGRSPARRPPPPWRCSPLPSTTSSPCWPAPRRETGSSGASTTC